MSSRQRLAWLVLLASFSACIGLALAVPIGVGTILQRSRRSMEVTVQANQGTVGILFGDSETGALFAGQESQALDPTGEILTNAADSALVLFETPREGRLVARLQVYGNTSLTVDEGTVARFATSSAGHRLALTLDGGRLLLTIPDSIERALVVTVAFPQGDLTIAESGQYSIITSNAESQVSILRGKAAVSSENQRRELVSDQRVVLQANGSIEGPLDTERNLIANGDFSQAFTEWAALADSVELEGQPPVDIVVDDVIGEPTLRFTRLGIGHADAGIRQVVDADVTDFESLRLLLALRVVEQSLNVCGQAGSECPLIVRLEYVDQNGVSQVWQQGLFAVGAVGPDTPDVCLTCPPPLIGHEQVPFQQLAFFESENLMERLALLGIEPQHIRAITLIASGHSFQTELVEVALLAEE